MSYTGTPDLFDTGGKVKAERLPVIIPIDGEDGESAYDIAVRLGYSGTEEQWILSLKGRDGSDGEDGSDASVTKENIEAVLTGDINTHSHAGGSGGLTQAQILTRQL